MNAKDILWQKLLDTEKARLASLPPEELIAMESLASCEISHGETKFGYVLWHESPGTRLGTNVHSFVLQTTRGVFPCISKNYLAGFSIDANGKIIPIADEVLYAYD